MKKYITIGLAAVFILISGIVFYRQSQKSIVHTLEEMESTLTSYEMKGVLELVDDEALRSVDVQVAYLRQNDNDFFFVRLQDQDTQQTQDIIKNEQGVFVISQGFNRAFQFKSDWPNNGFKPYILQNIFGLMDSDYTEEKIRDGYVLVAPIQDMTHPSVTQTQILFDQHGTPKQINLLDEDGLEVIQFKINQLMLNQEIDPNIFTITPQQEVSVTVQEDLPLYPVESYQAELIDQLPVEEGHVLRYQGDVYFSLIQTSVTIQDELSIEWFEGDFDVYEEGLIMYSDKETTLIKDGIKTTIYSNDLSQDEKIGVLLSMQNNIVIQP